MLKRFLALALVSGVFALASGCDPNPGGPSAPTSLPPGAENAPPATPSAGIPGGKGGPTGGPAPAGLQ